MRARIAVSKARGRHHLVAARRQFRQRGATDGPARSGHEYSHPDAPSFPGLQPPALIGGSAETNAVGAAMPAVRNAAKAGVRTEYSSAGEG
jgi:hypothetical protein